MSRFLNEKMHGFCEKRGKRILKDYSMFLVFDWPKGVEGESGFVLAGNIWIIDISESDVIPEAFRPGNVRKVLGDGWGQIEITTEISPWGQHCFSHESDMT